MENLARNDFNEQVRRSAVGGLYYSRNPKALEAIEAAAKDPSEYVSDYANWALERLREGWEK